MKKFNIKLFNINEGNFMNKEVEEVELIIGEAEDVNRFLRFMFEGK